MMIAIMMIAIMTISDVNNEKDNEYVPTYDEYVPTDEFMKIIDSIEQKHSKSVCMVHSNLNNILIFG